ncbi:hypothetical protein WMF31_27920 [Sorangium sp. So ce1036]|uniref:hypothetical protein n=1 Tax=Sorangium sp. So ce1036 TaxID=3133328 RepID=UPI003F0FFA9A
MARPIKVTTDRSPTNLLVAMVLLGSGSFLWIRAALSAPSTLALTAAMDGCLTAGIAGVMLALLHGIRYRTALLTLAAPIVLVQFVASGATVPSFLPVLGLELTAFGLFGLPLSRLPQRRPTAPGSAHAMGPAHPSPS